MKIKGTKEVLMVKMSILQSLGLSASDAKALKRGREIDVEKADELIKKGFASVVEGEVKKKVFKKEIKKEPKAIFKFEEEDNHGLE